MRDLFDPYHYIKCMSLAPRAREMLIADPKNPSFPLKLHYTEAFEFANKAQAENPGFVFFASDILSGALIEFPSIKSLLGKLQIAP